MQDKIAAFAEVCVQVGSLGHGPGWDAQVEQFVGEVPLGQLIEELEKASLSGDTTQIDVLCLVLKQIFRSKIGSQAVVSESFVPALLKGLGHFSEKVRKLTVLQIAQIGLASFQQVSDPQTLVEAVCEALYDVETGISVQASEALAEFAKVNRTMVLQGLKQLRFQDIERAEKADPSVALLRIFHLTAKIAARDAESFQECDQLGLLDPLINVVGGEDILIQLNALKLLPLISATQGGLDKLLSSNVVANLQAMAGLSPESGGASDPFLGDEALRVMSLLAARSQDSSLVEQFLKAIVMRLEDIQRHHSSDTALKLAVLEMLGAFAGSQPPQSLRLVLEQHHNDVLVPWTELATKSQEELKVAGIASITAGLRGGAILQDDNPTVHHQSSDEAEFAALIEESMTKPSPEDRQGAATFGKDLYVAFGTALNQRLRKFPVERALTIADVTDLMFDFLKQPMDELRCAVYALLRCVAGQDHEWGLRAIYSTTDQVEKLLMDRTIDMTKQAKEWRFALFEAIFHNPHRDAVLGQMRLDMLRTFLRRGPYLGPEADHAPQVDLASA